MDTNKLYTPDEAVTQGFDIPRSEVLAATGWSKATLGRRMDPENGELKLGKHFVYCKGRTKNTPYFNKLSLQLAGIHIAEPVSVSDLESQISNNYSADDLENAAAFSERYGTKGPLSRQPSPEQGSEHQHPTMALERPTASHGALQLNRPIDKVRADSVAIIELLKVKLYYTLEEAALMSGLTQAYIQPHTVLKGGRRVIHREELAKL